MFKGILVVSNASCKTCRPSLVVNTNRERVISIRVPLLSPLDGSDGICLHDGEAQMHLDTKPGALESPFLLMVTITDPERVWIKVHRPNTLGSQYKRFVVKLFHNIFDRVLGSHKPQEVLLVI
jgi:hypothetical protein